MLRISSRTWSVASDNYRERVSSAGKVYIRSCRYRIIDIGQLLVTTLREERCQDEGLWVETSCSFLQRWIRCFSCSHRNHCRTRLDIVQTSRNRLLSVQFRLL